MKPLLRIQPYLVGLLAMMIAACTDSATEPFAGTDATTPRFAVGTPASLEIWSPTDGAWLTGLHVVKARLNDRALDQYRMYWQVDGGSLVLMSNSQVDGAHKRAYVDFTSWKWNGTGPYVFNFVAKDRNGAVIGERAVWIYTGTRANPFSGARLYVDPYTNATAQAAAWRVSRPVDAAYMDRIAAQSQADWLGDWIPDVQTHVNARAAAITGAGALPVFVAYNIPERDCHSYSAGGATSAAAYRTWIRSVANGIGARKAVVVLEPDALGLLHCLSPADQQLRIDLIRDAVEVLKRKGRIAVYIDAGNATWHPAAEMAARLTAVRVAIADGFALNISNYIRTADNVAYGVALSGLLGGKQFIIDTSRNGLGPTADLQWCNPDGRALGALPGSPTGHVLADAFLWIKRPGESDGECNGGPSAGSWWAEYALGLAQRAEPLLASALP